MIAVNEHGKRIGEDHQHAKLTNEQVDRIRDLHEDHGLKYSQLAEMYGVSKSMIAGVCQYRRRAQTPFGWKKLEPDDEV
jgi:antitoxin component HigA of HigAB toxin-antitoxin module